MTPPTWLFWPVIIQPSGTVTATGGTVTDVGGYRYHTFTSGGTFTVTAGGSVDILVVGGGGGGGYGRAGGGGAGGVIQDSFSISEGAYSVTIGTGGAGATANGNGTSGNNTTFGALYTAIGGGCGSRIGFTPCSGGSGGGGGTGVSGAAGTTNQGNAGGNGSSYVSDALRAGGGGGGAGEAGSNGVEGVGGKGGDGIQWLDGNYYGGGGGGNCQTTRGLGGQGGGGNGSQSNISAQNGQANTGGGGGGSDSSTATPNNAGSGGSGIVIVRYPLPAVVLWAPSGLATLRAWYKADAITGLNDGDPVSTWSDSSGNGYDLTQTNNARPLYQTSTLNGLPVIEFDGTDDYLQASTASDWTFLHSDGSTVVAVWKAGTTANPGGGSAYSDGLLTTQTVTGSISGIRGASINYRNNQTAGVTDSVGHFINNGAGGGTWVVINISGSNEHPANAATIVSVTGDPANGTAANRSRIRVDGGSSIATNTNTNPRSTSSPNIALVLGTIGTSYLEGYIAEVVIFDAILSDADRQRVEGYLAHKWGLEGNLPVDHPYKTTPP